MALAAKHGIDLTGFKHVIEISGIQHAEKRHGANSNQAQKVMSPIPQALAQFPHASYYITNPQTQPAANLTRRPAQMSFEHSLVSSLSWNMIHA